MNGKTCTSPSAVIYFSQQNTTKQTGASRSDVYTDDILLTKLDFTELIVAQKKNYLYGTYKVSPSFSPSSTNCNEPTTHRHRHVMPTAHTKTPSQTQDLTRMGKDDLDKGSKKSKFGYPVLGLYKLRERFKVGKMREYGVGPPQLPDDQTRHRLFVPLFKLWIDLPCRSSIGQSLAFSLNYSDR